ncbi:MAG: winged helix-turn-helix transcriptional regulator, partial [Lachnospiraceae bacterium]|nr:winged helix-turn-helix transcriptional regulator [Lachnospiraceae bacterium]
MDSMDRSILKCLSENSRQSATQISHQVHLSIAAVIERIRKLERNGIIQQYT